MDSCFAFAFAGDSCVAFVFAGEPPKSVATAAAGDGVSPVLLAFAGGSAVAMIGSWAPTPLPAVAGRVVKKGLVRDGPDVVPGLGAGLSSRSIGSCGPPFAAAARDPAFAKSNNFFLGAMDRRETHLDLGLQKRGMLHRV